MPPRLLLSLLSLLPVLASAAETYDARFHLEFVPHQRAAFGSLKLGRNADQVQALRLKMPGPRYELLEADGDIHRGGDELLWTPRGKNPELRYKIRVDDQRKNGGYDNYYTKTWAIFRGDDVFPAASVRTRAGARSVSTLSFSAPSSWNIDTPYRRDEAGIFHVDNPARRFDRPVGWMIAGLVGTRREVVSGTELSIAAPKGEDMRRMDLLALLSYNLPEMQRAFGKLPEKILIVAGPDPMWRGGLSGPNSLYLHLSRPMISENSTSPILHELVHVVTRIRGKPGGDYIAEGLAEFYGIELLRRSGGIGEERFTRTRQWLAEWSKGTTKLTVDRSSGKTTARAVLLFIALDEEIRQATDNRRSIDDVTRLLMNQAKVDTDDLRKAARQVLGKPSKVLDTPLLKG